jgi:hypothetical protein
MKYIIEDTTLSNIADAIRSKNGESEQYTPEQMAEKIEEIEGGGSGGGGYTIAYRESGAEGMTEEVIQDIENGFWFDGYKMFDNVMGFDYSQLNNKKMNLTNCQYMFHGSYLNNTDLDISKFDTSKVFEFSNMFQGVENPGKINVSGISTEKGTTFSYMFANVKNTELDLDISSFNLGTAQIDKTGTNMFYGCKLNSIKFPEVGNISCNYFFYNSTINKYVDLGGFSCSGQPSNFLYGATLYEGITLPALPQARSAIELFNSNTKIYRIKYGGDKAFGSSYPTYTATLNLAYLWKDEKTTEIPTEFGGGTFEDAFLEFANSICVNATGSSRTIKLYTALYNSLTDEQKSLLIDKGYTLAYGTS